jgi:hypothetical protein
MQFEARKYQTNATPANTENFLPAGAQAIAFRPLFSWTNNESIQMMMAASGNLGLGTGSTGDIFSRLVVKGSGTTAGTSSFHIMDGNGVTKLFVRDDGNIGIGTSAPLALFHVDQSNDSRWNCLMYNGGGGAKILRIKGGWNGGAAPLLQIEANSTVSDYNEDNVIFKVQANGQVGINTTTMANGFSLSVAGKIMTEGISCKLKANWPDYVLGKNYQLMPVQKVDEYISLNGHLPGVPSEKDLKEDGLDLANMQAIHMQKIEELTLYTIQQEKELAKQQQEIAALKTVMEKQQSELALLIQKLEVENKSK